MITKRTIGPKGQVVIPETMRRTLGLKPGMRVIFELKNDKIIVRPEVNPKEYVSYYVRTHAKKLTNEIDLDKIVEEEVESRVGLRG